MSIDPRKRMSSQSSDPANNGGKGQANPGADDDTNRGESGSAGQGERKGRRSRSGRSGKSSSGSSGKSSSRGSGKGKSKAGLGKKLSRSTGKLTEGIEKGFRVFADAFGGVVDMILARPRVDLRINDEGKLDWPVDSKVGDVAVNAEDVSFDKITITDGLVRVRDLRFDREVIVKKINAVASARSRTIPPTASS